MCAGTDKPNTISFNVHIRGDAALQWPKLGEQLLMKTFTHNLDIIAEEHKGDDKKCCSEMFTLWLKKNFKASWNKMLHALEQSGYNKVAATIKRNDAIKG